MIAITFALPAESSGLVRLLRDNREVAIVHTGVGAKMCRRKIDNYLREAKPRLMLSSGFAGGVSENLEPGDLFLAENYSDADLLASAKALLGNRARVGKLFSAASIVDSIAERNEIARTQGTAAVDMETESIAQACAAHAIPLLSLRVITDTITHPLPAPQRVLFDLDRQRTDGARLAFHLLTHPHLIPRLIRFSRTIANAREVLTDAIVFLLPALPN
ncbi:MAG: hypothetical protein ABJB69_00465 [Spartobacteria bacterium]